VSIQSDGDEHARLAVTDDPAAAAVTVVVPSRPCGDRLINYPPHPRSPRRGWPPDDEPKGGREGKSPAPFRHGARIAFPTPAATRPIVQNHIIYSNSYARARPTHTLVDDIKIQYNMLNGREYYPRAWFSRRKLTTLFIHPGTKSESCKIYLPSVNPAS